MSQGDEYSLFQEKNGWPYDFPGIFGEILIKCKQVK